MGLLFVLALIGIANTMLMAIFERTKEIGMLRALGMRDGDLIRLFVLEAALIGFIGSIIGILLALPFDAWVIYKGIDYTSIIETGAMTDFGYRTVIFKGAWNYLTIFISPIVGTILAALTAIFPALKAIKMEISETLRFE